MTFRHRTTTSRCRHRRGVAIVELAAHMPALMFVLGLTVFGFRAAVARIATLWDVRPDERAVAGSLKPSATTPGPVSGLMTQRFEATRGVGWGGDGLPRPERWAIALQTTARNVSVRPGSSRTTAAWEWRPPLQVLPRPNVSLLGDR